MPTAAELIAAYSLTPERIARATNRTPDDVIAWADGSASCPVYFELVCRAVQARHKPATVQRMNDPNIGMSLGVPAAQAAYWHKTQQYPMAARLAVAALDMAAPQLTQYDIKLLGQIIRAGRYFRRPNGWYARHVMGKPMPRMRLHTIDALRRHGYVTVTGDILTVTEKGSGRWFIR